MLIAMESSCIACFRGDFFRCLSRVEPTKRRQCSLSQADSAVIRRNRMIRPDPQRPVCQQAFQILKQQLVLKNSAGENNGIQFVTVRDYAQSVMQTLSNSTVEGSCNFPDVTGANSIFTDRLQQRAKIEFGACEGGGRGRRKRRGTGELLEPDGSLSFKRDAASKAEKGCRRVKQTSHRGRSERPHIFAH